MIFLTSELHRTVPDDKATPPATKSASSKNHSASPDVVTLLPETYRLRPATRGCGILAG